MQNEQLEAMAHALENCSCSGLRRTMRLTTNLFDDAFAPIGLRCTQLSVLMAAAVHGPVAISQLAEIVVLEPSSLSRALTPLERDGLLVREIDPNSRRSRKVLITEAGMAKLMQAAPLWEEAQKTFMGILGEENLPAFQQIIARTAKAEEFQQSAKAEEALLLAAE